MDGRGHPRPGGAHRGGDRREHRPRSGDRQGPRRPGRAKLANLLFTYELQRRLAQAGSSTIAVAAHPGMSNTELVRNSPRVLRVLNAAFVSPFAQSAARGALPTLRAATDPTVVGGQYYGPDGFRELRGHPTVVASSRRSHDTDTQQRLWAISEDLTGVSYSI